MTRWREAVRVRDASERCLRQIPLAEAGYFGVAAAMTRRRMLDLSNATPNLDCADDSVNAS